MLTLVRRARAGGSTSPPIDEPPLRRSLQHQQSWASLDPELVAEELKRAFEHASAYPDLPLRSSLSRSTSGDDEIGSPVRSSKQRPESPRTVYSSRSLAPAPAAPPYLVQTQASPCKPAGPTGVPTGRGCASVADAMATLEAVSAAACAEIAAQEHSIEELVDDLRQTKLQLQAVLRQAQHQQRGSRIIRRHYGVLEV